MRAGKAGSKTSCGEEAEGLRKVPGARVEIVK